MARYLSGKAEPPPYVEMELEWLCIMDEEHLELLARQNPTEALESALRQTRADMASVQSRRAGEKKHIARLMTALQTLIEKCEAAGVDIDDARAALSRYT